MTDAATDISTLSFEDALSQLEKVVQKLESGAAPLEESLKLYTYGAELKAHCEKRLEDARLQVEKISLSKTGQVEGVAPAEFN
ncbi:MAG: exodeoxyribonuclease VII small subunit [Asticcacaulis sp. 32-58-5]|nr:MAG: exodeoxyribonuclease VII small subunit [Asticcacaulis sp. 32-58-5]